MPTSLKRRKARSASTTSSGDRTIRARSRNSATPVNGDDSAVSDDPEEVASGGESEGSHDDPLRATSPAKPHHPASISAEETSLNTVPSHESPRPSSLLRMATTHRFEQDMGEGPSDYWRRRTPSPDVEGDAADSPSWRDSMPARSYTPDGEEDNSDSVEYSRRLEQMRAIDRSPSPSPSSRRNRNRAAIADSWGMDGAEEMADWGSAQQPDFHARHKQTSLEEEHGAEMDDMQGEEEFGAFRSPGDYTSDRTPSIASVSVSVQEGMRPLHASPSGPSRSYIHPSVSRLRSQPHTRNVSTSTFLSATSSNLLARPPSHFSQVSMSRSDSFSTMSQAGQTHLTAREAPDAPIVKDIGDQGPAFSFHPLRQLSASLFNRDKENGNGTANRVAAPSPPPPAQKTSWLTRVSTGRSGTEPPPDPSTITFGKPTVIDVNGMIAVGCESGHVVVYTFAQDVRTILGTPTTLDSGPVTAVTISPDQTWVGVGHANGNIFLYDLATPIKPARTCLALPLPQVLSGRKEGHLQGRRIISIGFVGKRHTSIVTADEDGRAFWFSLGRVIGVDSNDVVRMLGSYPERDQVQDPRPATPPTATEGGEATVTSGPTSIRSQHAKRATTLFAALPLPLGEGPHATDGFHISALLTPVKLVVVGMKPSAKTWFRKMRNDAGGPYGGYVGCASWLRSGEVAAGDGRTPSSDPVLAYSWGTTLRFLRVRIVTTPAPEPKPGDKRAEPTKTPEFIEGKKWEAPRAIHAMQWFDSDHLLLVTNHQLLLFNVRSMSPVEATPFQTSLLTSQDFYSGLHLRHAEIDAIPNTIVSSCRVVRGKVFLLTRANVQVGTLQYWNDRVLANVHRGDFLTAIKLALAYYEGRALGNTINLPDHPEERKEVVGTRIKDLMRASLDWAFSEDRMHDDTHFSADGRGVDLTSLFEGLATACIDACLAMGDTAFLFNDTYEHFADVGIQGIFLTRLESYIFEGRISDVPPNVVQALIALHDQREEYAEAEAIIWHIEPSSLDIDQAVTLCETRGLWDALIHVYTRAMGDYVAPIVKLISIICHIQRSRRDRPSLVGGDEGKGNEDEERLAPDAYKLYAYVANVLSGLWYPSGQTMPEHLGQRARDAAYTMIFSDSNIVWPEGSGDVIETEQNAVGMSDPAYPYLRLLLRFDTEAFLHAMDIAFEDPYLNDSDVISRQTIINLMLDVMDDTFHSSDVTFLHIFVARNLPKYPQFIFIPPSTSHRILVSLAADPDQSTREDRQLAAEYLLSAYTPHDTDEMLARFEDAGFFRILRAAFRRDRKWGALIDTLLKDPDVDDGVFSNLAEIVAVSKSSLGIVPNEVVTAVTEALPYLFDLSVRRTAHLIDKSLPTLHDTAIAELDGIEHKQVAYLRCLLDPSSDFGESEDGETSEEAHKSSHLHASARHKYVSLLTRQDPSSVISFLDVQSPAAFELPRLAEEFEAADFPEGQLWALDKLGKTKETFETVDAVLASRGSDLAESIHSISEGDVHVALTTLSGVTHMAIRLCREHSDDRSEDTWFGVLHSITSVVHSISALSQSELRTTSLETLRSLVQDTLQALLSTASPHISFARLFKRLVEASPSKDGGVRAYSEFRSILSGMLDSFRADTDTLELTIRLVEADTFNLLEERVEKSQHGWRPHSGHCNKCHKPLWKSDDKVAIRADGTPFHIACT